MVHDGNVQGSDQKEPLAAQLAQARAAMRRRGRRRQEAMEREALRRQADKADAMRAFLGMVRLPDGSSGLEGFEAWKAHQRGGDAL